MRLKFPTWALIVLILLLGRSHDALTQSKDVIRIAIGNDYAPYSFVGVDGKPKGLLVDYWTLWGKEVGTAIEFRPYAFKESISALSLGEVDFHAGLPHVEQWRRMVEYLPQIYPTQGYLYVKMTSAQRDDIDVNKLLSTQIIGVVGGSSYDIYLQDNYPRSKIKRFQTPTLMRDAITNGELSAFLTDSTIAWLQLSSTSARGQFKKIDIRYPNNGLHPAIAHNKFSLRRQIEQGTAFISQAEFIAIENKWIDNRSKRQLDPDKVSSLHSTIELTPQERAWLQTKPMMTIAMVKDWPPYHFLDSNGVETGYNIELINMINNNLNIEITPEYHDTWNNAFIAVKQHKAAGVASLSWSEQRAKTFAYSPVYLNSPHYLIVKQHNEKVKDANNLNGARVSLFKNQLLSSLLQQQLADLKPVYITSPLQGLEQVRDGESDVVLASRPDYQVLFDMGLEIAGQFYSKASEFSIGSLKTNRTFSSIIAKGIDSLSAQQRKTLYNNWLKPPPLTSSVFSAAEREFIKQHRQIRIGTNSWKPIIYQDNDRISGIVADMLSEITKISGLEFEVKVGYWSEILAAFKRGEIDFLPNAYKTPEREKYALFSDGYFDLSLSIFVRERDTWVRDFDDLKGKKVAIIRADAYNDIIAKRYPDIILVGSNSIEQSLSLLLNKQVDAMLDLDVVVNQVLKDGLYQGVRGVMQTQIESRALHFMSQKKFPLLQSILNKSLRSIRKKSMEQITDKWVGSQRSHQVVKVAFGMGRPPYLIEGNSIKGIEFDLIKRILELSNIKVSSVKDLSMDEINRVLEQDPELDMAVSVKQKADDLFYSDNFISIENVVITRKGDAIRVEQVEDLAGKSIIAFKGAHRMLGDKFSTLYKEDRFAAYREVNMQIQQVELFMTGQGDVLIMGKNVFRWLARKYGFARLEQFSLQGELFAKNDLQVAFKSESLRDLFNKNLALVKSSGEYQKLTDDYVTGMAVEKLEISSLLANVLSRDIYATNIADIELIVSKVVTLPHIVKLEVFNHNERLLYRSSKKISFNYTRYESNNTVSGFSQNVGYIKVYFDDNALSQKIDENNFIPPISLFKTYSRYKSIKDIYKLFGYFNQDVSFSPLEKYYLATRSSVTFSEAMWAPLFSYNGEQYQGVVADYLALISKFSGLEFDFQSYGDWSQVRTAFDNKAIELLPSVSFDKDINNDKVRFSRPYASFNFAMVMTEQGHFVNTIDDLANNVFALPKDYSSFHYIKSNFPHIKVIETTSPEQALELVRNGTADVFVGHLALVSAQLEQGFSDLKLVGLLDYQYLHKMMVQGDDKLLLAIINKSIDAITPEQHSQIESRWMHQKVNTAVDYSIIYQLISVFTIITVIILIFLKRLSKAKTQLERSLNELQLAQQHLVESEKMAGLGALVAGVAHEINTPVGIGLTAVSHFVDITNSLENSYQENNISKNQLGTYLKDASEVANILNRNLERTAQLVSSFKQISVDQSSDEMRTFNMADYVDEILISISHVTKRSQAQITLHCDPKLVIKSCPGAISQILSNLIINSTIHGYPNNEPGNIEIKITAKGSLIQVQYRDDGAGICAENLPKIFDPFFTTNREFGGSGLGLNIIYNIVTNRLAGTIECQSTRGQGTEFNISFSVV